MVTEQTVRVLIAKPGLDGHDRGAKVIARALRDAGMEVIYTGLRQTPEMIAEAALQEDVDVVGLSILSGAHLALVPRIRQVMDQNGLNDVPLLVGGIIPDEDKPKLEALGVSGIFGPGTNTDAIVTFIHELMKAKTGESMIERVQQVLDGDRRALARLLTHVENEREGVEQALAALFPYTGRAWVIGVTGAPGTGKSTLVNEMTKLYRAQEKTVAILAIDPTSPFTGGALLGDRVRMRDLSGDSGVFIRSMATRGSLGGLARAARDAIRVLDAGGFDVVLVETVGAGQNEVDIVRAADTTVVVEAPGMGDEVQAIKAGILEIADVLVVNKADRPGVNHTVRALKMMLEIGHPSSRSQMSAHHGRLLPAHEVVPTQDSHEAMWLPPIVQTVASGGKGVDEVVSAIAEHRRFLEANDLRETVERQHIEVELYERLRDSLMARLLQDVPASAIATMIEQIQAREIDPQSAVRQILAQVEG